MLKEDGAKTCAIVSTLQSNRSSMDEWQVALTDRITPKCHSLVGDIDAALSLLDQRAQPFFAPTYGPLVGDIQDRVTGIARTANEFLSSADRQTKK